MNDKKLKELRGAKVEEIDALFNAAKEEERSLSGEELDKVEGLETEVRDLERQIEAEYRHAAAKAKELNTPSKSEKRDLEKFSFSKFIRQLSHDNLDGIEAEMAQEGNREALASGISPRGTILSQKAFEARDMTATGGSGLDQGGMTIPTMKLSLLEELFNRQVLAQAGATILTGLTGNFDVPRLVKGTLPVKKAENAQAVEYTATTAQVSFSPNRLPTVMEVSNQLLIQSNERALQQIFLRHLQSELMDVMQRGALHGAGTTEPVGVAATTGIGSVAGGAVGAAPDYADIVNLQKEVAVDNADFGSLAFVTNAKVEAKLKQTAKISSTDSLTIIDGYRNPGNIDGRPYHITNAVSSALTKSSATGLSAIFYGNWADLWIAQWGGFEFLVNPYSKDDYGLTRLNVSVYYDANVVRPVSFAAMTDAIA
jgi:HK97 family phage major capsid protein